VSICGGAVRRAGEHPDPVVTHDGDAADTRRNTMRYLLLIAGQEQSNGAADDESPMLAEYLEFGEEMGKRGVLKDGARLRPTSDATTVRVRDGETVTDGPFAETKEQIGGYYLVDCNDLDEAIEVAAQIPGAREGSIEVRPIWEL
jgi:hypothetical protein